MERKLIKQPEKEIIEDNSVRVVTTHGRDQKLVRTLKHIENIQSQYPSRSQRKPAPSLNNI